MKTSVYRILIAGQLLATWLAAGQTNNTRPLIQISPSSLNFGAVLSGATVTNTFTVLNAGGGVLSGTASVSDPFMVVSGGSYILGGNQSSTVSISYSPSGTNDSRTVKFTGGGSATGSVRGCLLPIQSGLSFPSYVGIITAPFVTNNGGYISQEVQTGVADGGHAVYGFFIENGGNYAVSAAVNSPDASANSLFVNIDSEPAAPLMIWDIPSTAGFTNQIVSWRGNGTSTSAQFVPAVFNLSLGAHQLIVVGREPGAQLGQITIAPYIANRPTPPAPPQNLHVVGISP